MTIQDMGEVLDVLTIAYPHLYRNFSDDEKYKASCLWAEMFSHDSVETVVNAVKAFIATDTKGFPSIGQIKMRVVKEMMVDSKTELEAWGEVRNALKRCAYNSAEEFEKMDPIIKRIVGSASVLKDWAMMDIEKLEMVISSNFQRSYRTLSTKHMDDIAIGIARHKEYIPLENERIGIQSN